MDDGLIRRGSSARSKSVNILITFSLRDCSGLCFTSKPRTPSSQSYCLSSIDLTKLCLNFALNSSNCVAIKIWISNVWQFLPYTIQFWRIFLLKVMCRNAPILSADNCCLPNRGVQTLFFGNLAAHPGRVRIAKNNRNNSIKTVNSCRALFTL